MSTLNVANISDGTDTVETGYVVNGSAKAWAKANASGVASNSFNISGVVDLGVGNCLVNFTNSMASVDPVALVSNQIAVSTPASLSASATASSAQIVNYVNSSLGDPVINYVQVQGELA
jgi:hypothetical protein